MSISSPLVMQGTRRRRGPSVEAIVAPSIANWHARVIANSGEVDANEVLASHELLATWWADGVTPYIKRANLLCGDFAACVVPLIGDGTIDTNAGFMSGDYSRAAGLTGDGSSYLTTPFYGAYFPSYVSDSRGAHISVYSRTNSSADVADIGYYVSTSEVMQINCKRTDGNAYGRLFNQTTGSVSAAVSDSLGHFIVTVGNGSWTELWQDGVRIATTSSAGGTVPYANQVLIFGNGTTFTSRILSGYTLGDGIPYTLAPKFSTAMQTFQSRLGRAV